VEGLPGVDTEQDDDACTGCTDDRTEPLLDAGVVRVVDANFID